MSKSVEELEDQLRAAQEVIAALQRRVSSQAQRSQATNVPVAKAIASLENTLEQRNRALARSEAHYRALFDRSPNLGFVLDEFGVIARANAAAMRSFSVRLLDRPFVELFVGNARESLEALLAEGTGEGHELELTNGSFVDVYMAALAELDQVQVIMHDVSERLVAKQRLEVQRETIRALGVPILEIWAGVSSLPILGVVDAQRSNDISEALLAHVARVRARHVIIDLTGAAFEAGTIGYLVDIVRAVDLLGTRGVFCGISPQMARALVVEGIELGEIAAYRNLGAALRACLLAETAPS